MLESRICQCDSRQSSEVVLISFHIFLYLRQSHLDGFNDRKSSLETKMAKVWKSNKCQQFRHWSLDICNSIWRMGLFQLNEIAIIDLLVSIWWICYFLMRLPSSSPLVLSDLILVELLLYLHLHTYQMHCNFFLFGLLLYEEGHLRAEVLMRNTFTLSPTLNLNWYTISWLN